jgi:glycine/D-amino acid oxidase-like deaminating enzyme
MRVVVVGAGVFGSWTALWLLRRGASVMLVEQYGPGNPLSSSGDESRVSRSAHGPDDHYPRWQRRALEQWRELDPSLVVPAGVTWFAGADDAFEAQSLDVLRRLDIPAERLEVAEAARRWPQIAMDGVAWVLHEPDGAALLARRAVAATVRAFVAEGGELRIGHASLDQDGVALEVDGRVPAFDSVVFAAGPWLPKLIGASVVDLAVTRQEVVYFSTPPGDGRFDIGHHPIWVEYGAAIYGLPSIEYRGFKVAPDDPGPIVDPDTQERRLTDERVATARAYLARRFPDLADRPVAEGRVCQYETTRDTHFVIDRLPSHPMLNAWVVGGGSGHGFKHGPVVGEYVSGLITGQPVGDLAPPDDRFALRPRVAGNGMRTGGAGHPTSASASAKRS